nr:hypothetical protein [uncultured Psychroserpens sp.]
MKNQLVVLVALLVSFFCTSQDQYIETKSVSIDNFITFIVEHIENNDEDSESSLRNVTFLLQTPISDLSPEDKVILKQAFKLISERLSLNDYISIVTYSGFNGIALKKTTPKDLKSIIYSIENLKSSINEFHNDGIELAYTYTKENLEEEAKNMVIMVRNPKSLIAKSSTVDQAQILQNGNEPKKNNLVLLTAITLLPQIISVIKD